MSRGSVTGLAIIAGIAYGCMDNRIDRIEARLSEADRRIALLTEELGDKKTSQIGDDGVHGRSEGGEEKTEDSLEPSPEGPALQGVPPFLGYGDGVGVMLVADDMLVEKACRHKRFFVGCDFVVERVVPNDGVVADARKHPDRFPVHASSIAKKGGAE